MEDQHFDIIRKRVSLVNDIKMSDEMFNEKADEFTRSILKHFGFELISKMIYFAPLRGEFWQLQYKK